MTDKQIIITAVFFVISYVVVLFFIFRYLYNVKLHVRKLYGKSAQLSEQVRDTQAIAAETQEELYLVKMKTTRNY